MPNGMSLMDYINKIISNGISKTVFGRMVHSGDPAEVESALEALAACDGYENLED